MNTWNYFKWSIFIFMVISFWKNSFAFVLWGTKKFCFFYKSVAERNKERKKTKEKLSAFIKFLRKFNFQLLQRYESSCWKQCELGSSQREKVGKLLERQKFKKFQPTFLNFLCVKISNVAFKECRSKSSEKLIIRLEWKCRRDRSTLETVSI